MNLGVYVLVLILNVSLCVWAAFTTLPMSHFTANAYLNNLYPTSTVEANSLITADVKSNIQECGVMCKSTPGCLSLFYHDDSNTCFLHRELFTTSSQTTTLANTKYMYFTDCPSGWVIFETSCFFIDKTACRSFEEAKNFCGLKSSHLVRIDSKAENDFLRNLFMNMDVNCSNFLYIAALLFGSLVTCFASSKKGVAINGGNSYHCGDEDALSNVHWWYDWHSTPWQHQAKGCSSHVKHGYVPMVWGWRRNIDYPVHLQSNTQYVLGFNEPNFRGQANLSPQDAARYWPELEKASNGRTMVSPAVAPGGNPLDPVSWLEQFFQACHGCRVDHIATHAYWCNADITMNFLQELWNKFHKPIWLTEFACPQKNSVNDQLNYMKAILPRLESAPHVFRYAWFVSRTHGDGWVFPAASLLENYGPHLTQLGQYYNNF